MIMISRYIALVGDWDTPYNWDSMYAGEFATVEEAVKATKEKILEEGDDYWEVIDLMSKKVVAEGDRKEALREIESKNNIASSG